LNSSGDYAAAHEWYRRLYEPFGLEQQRQIFPFDPYFTGAFKRSENWLADPLNPHTIAATRESAYLRQVILAMVKNLLDWADHEFAMGGPESWNRARKLYLLAEEILQAPALEDPCENARRALEFEIIKEYRLRYKKSKWDSELQKEIRSDIARLGWIKSHEMHAESLENIRNKLKSSMSLAEACNNIKDEVDRALQEESKRKSSGSIEVYLTKRNDKVEKIENAALPCFFASKNDWNDTVIPVPLTFTLCIPANPLLEMLQLHIASNLLKLRTCRTFSGEEAPVSPFPEGDYEELAMANQLSTPETSAPASPPRYRYSFLVEKARQYVGYGQQLEAAMLNALEKRDAEAYNRIIAKHALEVAGAHVSLKDLSVEEAKDAKEVAYLQYDRAHREAYFWVERTKHGLMGLSAAEVTGMGLTALGGIIQLLTVAPQGLAASAGMLATLAGTGLMSTVIGAEIGIPVSFGGLIAMGAGLAAGGQPMAQAFQSFGQLSLTFAGFERRWEEWKLNKDLAHYDLQIAKWGETLAQDREDIAKQEKKIADIEHRQAQEVLNFLCNKFTNRELYEWMIGELQKMYRTIMQISASTSALAQKALEFERQQKYNFIQGDYWTITEKSLSEKQRGYGLLGAERLIADLNLMDGFKVSTDNRPLQLSKTISLARTLPIDFVEFRKSGKIAFRTLMDWFDWDFPGHYMRLIKSVKVTVAALIPPADGIHAMLSNDGVSAVVVNEYGNFVQKVASRAFGESIALDSPFNESGLFVLDYNDPMLLPFEGLGVETNWTLELPRATNRFHFNTIVDVFFTIEYTALFDPSYKEQVIRRLGSKLKTDTILNVRVNYPDAWYHLKNPKKPQDGEQVAINVSEYALPPNLKKDLLRVRNLTVLVVGESGQSFSGLTIKREGLDIPVQTNDQGLFSTFDAGGADSANPFTAQRYDPMGEWQILLAPEIYQEVGGAKNIDKIEDIVLVLTLEGEIIWTQR
jgi:hypothetical protein